ncbi:MAG: hypothetical protein WA432_03720 [Candidatus Babeliaceae bacterium]
MCAVTHEGNRTVYLYKLLTRELKQAMQEIIKIPQALLLQLIQKNYEKYKKPLELNRSQYLFEVFYSLPVSIRTYLQETGCVKGLKTQYGGNIVQPT